MARIFNLLPWRRRRAEHDLERELRYHIDRRVRDLKERGMTEAGARRQAAVELGGISRVKEEVREAWVWRWIDKGRRDFALAARMLAKNPGFAMTVVLTLAVGIGTTAGVSSVAEPLLTRPLPVDAPGELVLFRTVDPGSPDRADYVPEELFHRLSADSSTLSGVLGTKIRPGHWSVRRDDPGADPDGVSAHVQIETVTGSYFQVLGVRAALGRLLTETDEQRDALQVAVISNRLWQQHFGGAADILGATIRLTQLTLERSASPEVTIIGVAAPGFSGVDLDSDPDVWIPFRVVDILAFTSDSGLGAYDGLRVMGRMRTGIGLDAVRAEISVLVPQMREPTWAVDARGVPNVRAEGGRRGYSDLRFEFSQPVLALGAGVGLVLLIAWANVGALMLTRVMSRERETAVRLALGSSRRGLLGPFVAEGLILSTPGAIGGIFLARAGVGAMTAYFPAESGLASQVGLGGWIVLLTSGVTILGVFAFALIPAMKTSGARGIAAIAGLPGSLKRRSGVFEAHRIVVATQVALSLVLLVGAVLFLQTLGNLRSLEIGFGARRVLDFRIEAPRSERWRDFHRSGLGLIEALPGVEAATFYDGPLTEGPLRYMAMSLGPDREAVPAVALSIGPGFLETTGIPLVSGRPFAEVVPSGGIITEGEDAGVILSSVLARQLFGDANPIGRTVFSGIARLDPSSSDRMVVGVVGDIRAGFGREPSPMFYVSGAAYPRRFLVRTTGDPRGLVGRIRQAVEEFDPGFRLAGVQTLEEAREASIAPERFVAELAAFMGLAALALVAVGLLGAFSYAAARRRAEVGLRMALGAERRAIVSLMMREVLWILGAGMALGVFLAFATTRLVSGILFGVVPMDPVSVLVAVLILAGVSAAAAYVPVRRASRLDPMVVLRHE